MTETLYRENNTTIGHLRRALAWQRARGVEGGSVSKFKVGDSVFHMGGWGLGTVVEIKHSRAVEIPVQFSDVLGFFNSRGFLLQDEDSSGLHKFPTLLTLDEARARGFDVPKIKVKKQIDRWIKMNPYKGGGANDTVLYRSKEEARRHAACDEVVVHLVGEYEVEE